MQTERAEGFVNEYRQLTSGQWIALSTMENMDGVSRRVISNRLDEAVLWGTTLLAAIEMKERARDRWSWELKGNDRTRPLVRLGS